MDMTVCLIGKTDDDRLIWLMMIVPLMEWLMVMIACLIAWLIDWLIEWWLNVIDECLFVECDCLFDLLIQLIDGYD